MEPNIVIDKLELTKWLINLEDKNILEKIAHLMNENKKPKYDAAYEATLSNEEKAAYWQEVGYTLEESKQRTLDRIAKWKEKVK